MRRAIVIAVLAGWGLAPGQGWAQSGSVRTSVLYERYTFKEGLSFNRIIQFTVPVAIDINAGRLGALAISSGYTKVNLRSADATVLGHQVLSGALNTELRWTFPLIRDRLYMIARGAVPTGIMEVQNDELAVLGALSSDVIGFAAPNVGGGANVGGGVVAAVPVGSMALGVAATARRNGGYVPIAGQSRLKPGNEFRFRAGLEGPLGRRTYLRVAGVVATRQKDRFAGETRHGVGNRFVGYLALNQGVGNLNLTLYGFDVFRADPQIQESAVGAAFLPRGNLLGLGLESTFPLNPGTSLLGRAEYRTSAQAADTSSTQLRRLGSSARFGLGVRQRVTDRFALVLRGSGLTGNVRQDARNINLSGYRAELHLELIP